MATTDVTQPDPPASLPLAGRIALHRGAAGPRRRPRLLSVLGPGLITGASDDDPSGIATYSQAGAQFGYGLSWVMLFSYPLMSAIQEISARIGRVTGQGIAGNLRNHYPPWLLQLTIGLLLIANTINLATDLGAMGASLRLIVGGSARFYVVVFAIVCVSLEIFSRYERYVSILKWTTLSLFAYVATVFFVHVPWGTVAYNIFIPVFPRDQDFITVIVAVLGTTISPYLFFWQSSEEAEDERDTPGARPLMMVPDEAPKEIRRIRIDTYVGMALSNIIGLFIILTAATTLHARGVTDIQTAADAANALRPIAGPLTFTIFAIGIIGTGLLAVPVLAGSAAYAIGEARGWPTGLGRRVLDAKAFYATIVAATLVGILINLVNVNPMKALFWCAVLNGIVAVPVMAVMMHMAMEPEVMGKLTLPRPLLIMGWLTTAVMAATVAALFVTWVW